MQSVMGVGFGVGAGVVVGELGKEGLDWGRGVRGVVGGFVGREVGGVGTNSWNLPYLVANKYV